LGAGADFVQEFEVVLIADGTFYQAHGDALGILFAVHDRAVNDIDHIGEFDEEFVEVEK
jgi:hypothetical protein